MVDFSTACQDAQEIAEDCGCDMYIVDYGLGDFEALDRIFMEYADRWADRLFTVAIFPAKLNMKAT